MSCGKNNTPNNKRKDSLTLFSYFKKRKDESKDECNEFVKDLTSEVEARAAIKEDTLSQPSTSTASEPESNDDIGLMVMKEKVNYILILYESRC